MGTLSTIVTVIQLLTCIFLIVVVLLQSGKKPGLSSAIGGGNGESYLSKNKSGSMDAKLAKWTKWVGLAFALLTLSLSLIN